MVGRVRTAAADAIRLITSVLSSLVDKAAGPGSLRASDDPALTLDVTLVATDSTASQADGVAATASRARTRPSHTIGPRPCRVRATGSAMAPTVRTSCFGTVSDALRHSART